jgi:hypothetical protein
VKEGLSILVSARKITDSQDRVQGLEWGRVWEAAFKIALVALLCLLFLNLRGPSAGCSRGFEGFVGIPNWSDLLTRATGLTLSFWLCFSPLLFYYGKFQTLQK